MLVRGLEEEFDISIHAPLARRDVVPAASARSKTPFQSTRLLRGATRKTRLFALCHDISIHAPLARRDFNRRFARKDMGHFNPRASCEARPHGRSRR